MVNSEHYHHTIYSSGFANRVCYFLLALLHTLSRRCRRRRHFFCSLRQSHLFVQVYFTVTAERFLTLSNQPQLFVRQEHESGEILMGQPHSPCTKQWWHCEMYTHIAHHTYNQKHSGNADALAHTGTHVSIKRREQQERKGEQKTS